LEAVYLKKAVTHKEATKRRERKGCVKGRSRICRKVKILLIRFERIERKERMLGRSRGKDLYGQFVNLML